MILRAEPTQTFLKIRIYRNFKMFLGLVLLGTFLSLSEQYEDTFSKRIEPQNFLQFSSIAQEPTHFQYSSFGSQSSSAESNQISPEPFIRRPPFNSYQNGLDDKFREPRDFEDRQRINKFHETRDFESRQSDEKMHGLRDFDGRMNDDKFQEMKEFMGRQRNEKLQGTQKFEPRERYEKFQGTQNFEPRERNEKFHGAQNIEPRERNEKFHGGQNIEPRERNEKFQEIKDLGVRRRTDKFQGSRDTVPQRNIRYEEGFRGIPSSESGRSNRPSKPWHSSHFVDHRGRQRHPRLSSSSRRDSYKVRENFHFDGKRPVMSEIKRSPRIIKYIADKNGFAIREDLVKPLQDTIDRTRQESRRRIVTASSAGLPQNSLMSQVVTSAIRVSGQSPGNGDGKFVPQIFDLNVGKKSNHIDIDKLAYSLGAKEIIL
ncbi:uncharacterized protein NPIL_488201 [Nephila pilipes]|uniref:Uncharacterized protein n=1 Tax=Nephila pilipes TaxID=299642 RepID=A0A8X6P1R3_NEPPI|nr:uncharacterized protein NPIL_488201 [Nephila pilipes]